MFSSTNRAVPTFLKPKEVEKKDTKYDDLVNVLFEENGLYRKRLPKGPDSLMRAISETLYFTPNHHEEIQQSLIRHLTQLIASDKLTSRLSTFQGNSMMLKDFANNPQLNGFEKTNLELVSSFFKARVILYTMNEDNFLTAAIFNNNHPNSIELLRTKTGHYDAVFAQSFIKRAGVCQNILLNIIDKVINGSSGQAKDNETDEYVNLTYENSLLNNAEVKESPQLDQFRITRGQHKKSLSDNFNTNFEFMEEQQMKFYDAFINAAPPDDFLKNFNTRKDTAESGFSINANFDFIDDQTPESAAGAREFAIKNYPIQSEGLSPRAGGALELYSPMPVFSKAKFGNHPNVLFGENLSLVEMERLEKNLGTAATLDPKQMAASPYYRSNSPPGLTPTRFSQRSFTDAAQTTQNDYLSPSPTMHRDANLQGLSPAYRFDNTPGKRNMSSSYMQANFQGTPQSHNGQNYQYGNQQAQAFAPQSQTLNPQSQTFMLQPQQYSSLYMKRTGTAGTSISSISQSQDFGMGPQSAGYESYDQSPGYDGANYDPNMMFGQGYNFLPKEKKKPIILDEGTERYTGRLKFYDDNKKYGFIVMDNDGSDIFVHYDDLIKANINKELLKTARMGNVIRLSFGCMAYLGKYNKSRKATDIELLM